jgi:hypothetical protein
VDGVAQPAAGAEATPPTPLGGFGVPRRCAVRHDNSVVVPYPVWQSGFVEEPPEPLQRTVLRNPPAATDARLTLAMNPTTRYRAEPAVTDDAKSQATRWTRVRDVVPRVMEHTTAISPTSQYE